MIKQFNELAPEEIESLKKITDKGLYQSYLWAELRNKSNEKPIIITYGSPIKGAMVLFEHSKSIPGLGKKKILFSQGNPIGDNLNEILEEFKKESKKYFYGTIAPTAVNLKNEEFEKAGLYKISNWTILVDLNKTQEELWGAMEKKSARWGVKTAEKNNLVFELAKNQDIQKFYELYSGTATSGGFKAENIDFVKEFADSPLSKLFLVKKDDEVIAGGIILIDYKNNYSILDLTGASDKGLELQAMPFLYWNLIKYSKSLNLNYFDLGGYDKEAKEGDKTYNINKFKERFGGNVSEQPIFSTNKKYLFLRNILKKIKAIKPKTKHN
ncbi:MAG: peptidoglycan bridge formation glycyltransferase FemA/FemB family protein [Candidatus Pacearchaeota archaeon]|jgi:lipid II:glycine glycyltransferase (peptidoglycan interpeptide bridge formation enzyme)